MDFSLTKMFRLAFLASSNGYKEYAHRAKNPESEANYSLHNLSSSVGCMEIYFHKTGCENGMWVELAYDNVRWQNSGTARVEPPNSITRQLIV
jgi:hypothetical protein